jgi:hypothetical protein
MNPACRMRLLPLLVVALALVFLLDCGVSRASIALSVTPNPIPLYPVAPGHGLRAYGAAWTVTVVETAGLGGTIESVATVVRETTTGRDLGQDVLDAAGIAHEAGTARVQSLGTLSVPQQVVLPFDPLVPPPRFGPLAFLVSVRFIDDEGHVLTQSLQVSEALPRFDQP